MVEFGEHLRHVAHDDAAREAFGDGRLADAGIADEQRVVLLPAAQHLDGALNLGGPPDQGIDPAGARLLVQVDAIDFERIGAALLLVAAFDRRGILFHAAHGARLGHAGALGDAVADVVHRIEAGHVLLLQEEGGVALALGEDRHQHIGAGHLLAAGGLHMSHGAMDNALEAGGRLGIVMRIEHEAGELIVEISGELVPQQVDIDVAGAHYRRGVAIVEQRQEEMLERRIFVAALIGILQSAPEGLFQTGRKGSHLDPHSFSMVHCSGCSFWRAKLVTWATLVSATSYV